MTTCIYCRREHQGSGAHCSECSNAFSRLVTSERKSLDAARHLCRVRNIPDQVEEAMRYLTEHVAALEAAEAELDRLTAVHTGEDQLTW